MAEIKYEIIKNADVLSPLPGAGMIQAFIKANNQEENKP